MTIDFTANGNTIQLTTSELEERLFHLRNAKKSTHRIRADLIVEKRGLLKNIIWIALSIFPEFRNRLFHTNLTESKENLGTIQKLVSENERLVKLVGECFDVLNAKREDSEKIHRSIQWATQGWFNGPNWKPNAKRYVKQLQEKATNGISFNTKKLSWMTMGGNCSAISLDFIKRYFESFSSMPLDPGNEDREPETIEDRLKQIARPYKWGGKWIKMRSQQAAFNCIEFEGSPPFNHVHAKIQALANLHNLNVISTSQNFDLMKDLRTKFSDITTHLSAGIYLLRVIEPSDNEKFELKGHSMVFKRSTEGDFFFDPNKGLEKIEGSTDERLFYHLKHNYKRFGISQAQFLKITPNLTT